MTRQAIIDRTIKLISQLPEDRAAEISDFADFVMKRYEDQKLNQAAQQLTADSKTYAFLETEEDLYQLSDLKEVCHTKR